MMRLWVFLLLIFPLLLMGSAYKGKKEYIRKCKKCHGNGAKFIKKRIIAQWEEVFANDGMKLKSWHAEVKGAKDYFNSPRFEKKMRHLKNFFTKYAADSGNVPACSD